MTKNAITYVTFAVLMARSLRGNFEPKANLTFLIDCLNVLKNLVRL